MQVIVFNRSLSNTRSLQLVCAGLDLTLTVHHSITNEGLAAFPSSRILIFDQSLLGTNRSITQAMYRVLQQDVIAVTCDNPTVSYAVAHMRMGAKWVFSADSCESVLNTGFSNLLTCAESVNTDYCEHIKLQAKFSGVSPTEWEVLNFVLAGKRNKEIAKELDVSIRTVESRRSRVCRKIGVHNLVSLVRCVDRATLLGNQFRVGNARCFPSTKCMDNDFQFEQLQRIISGETHLLVGSTPAYPDISTGSVRS